MNVRPLYLGAALLAAAPTAQAGSPLTRLDEALLNLPLSQISQEQLPEILRTSGEARVHETDFLGLVNPCSGQAKFEDGDYVRAIAQPKIAILIDAGQEGRSQGDVKYFITDLWVNKDLESISSMEGAINAGKPVQTLRILMKNRDSRGPALTTLSVDGRKPQPYNPADKDMAEKIDYALSLTLAALEQRGKCPSVDKIERITPYFEQENRYGISDQPVAPPANRQVRISDAPPPDMRISDEPNGLNTLGGVTTTYTGISDRTVDSGMPPEAMHNQGILNKLWDRKEESGSSDIPFTKDYNAAWNYACGDNVSFNMVDMDVGGRPVYGIHDNNGSGTAFKIGDGAWRWAGLNSEVDISKFEETASQGANCTSVNDGFSAAGGSILDMIVRKKDWKEELRETVERLGWKK